MQNRSAVEGQKGSDRWLSGHFFEAGASLGDMAERTRQPLPVRQDKEERRQPRLGQAFPNDQEDRVPIEVLQGLETGLAQRPHEGSRRRFCGRLG